MEKCKKLKRFLFTRVRMHQRQPRRKGICLWLHCVLILFWFSTCLAEFIYDDFEKVTALVFNGDSKTTSCDAGDRLAYQAEHGTNDPSIEKEIEVMSEDTRFVEVQSRRVNDHATSGTVDVDLAGFSHRDGRSLAPSITTG